METPKSANLLVRFLLELGILFSVCYWGFKTGTQIVAKIGLGIGAPVVIALSWGIFMAPASSRRLQDPWRLIAELVLFGFACFALFSAGQILLA